MDTVTSNKELIYIYETQQANAYMKSIRCLGTGVNKNTGGIFYIFNKEESAPLYKVWKNTQCLDNQLGQ